MLNKSIGLHHAESRLISSTLPNHDDLPITTNWLPRHQYWPNRAVVQQFNQTDEADPQAESEYSATVGYKIRQSKKFVAARGQKLSPLEEDRHLGRRNTVKEESNHWTRIKLIWDTTFPSTSAIAATTVSASRTQFVRYRTSIEWLQWDTGSSCKLTCSHIQTSGHHCSVDSGITLWAYHSELRWCISAQRYCRFEFPRTLASRT